MKDYFAKCGINCGHCPAFKGNAKTEKDRQRCSDGWHKYLGVKLKPEICVCEGCQASEPWKSGNLLPDRGCNVRPCVIKTGVKNCSYCSAYPCEELKTRIPGKDFKEYIESRGGYKIPEKDYHMFIEPYEGLRYLAEMRSCIKPEEIVKSYKVAPLKPRTVKFPDDLALPRKEKEGFKALHNLMVNLLSASRADTYARQLLFKRRRHHIMHMLWVFALYGEFKKKESNKLIISRDIHESHKVYMVRKRDGVLHIVWRQLFKMLLEFGVRAEFVPSKMDWRLTLSFDKSVGGSGTLRALKAYASKLVEKHGEPKYAGSNRHKGRAYELFTKVDMRVLK